MTAPASLPAGGKRGGIGTALIRLFMKRATIAASEALTGQFRLITLEGPELEGVAWSAGQKIQVAMGSAFVARTYTPIEWDRLGGQARILGFAHGSGPGSAWLLGARAGDVCDFLGPRASLDVRASGDPVVVFGDETSIGLACALAGEDPARSVSGCFEVSDAAGAALVLDRLGFVGARVFEREADDGHVAAMEAVLPAFIAAGAVFVLTGKAGTIQRIRQSLKRHGLASVRVVTKAYWAPGKAGLD